LIAASADLDAKDMDGNTALHNVVMEYHSEYSAICAQALIGAGSDPLSVCCPTPFLSPEPSTARSVLYVTHVAMDCVLDALLLSYTAEKD
jgi:ankyrin repeat protein